MSLFTKRYHPPGTPPGTLTLHPRAGETRIGIRLIDYDADQVTIHDDIQAGACVAHLRNEARTWIHVQGQADSDTVHELGRIFGLHALAVEDVLNSGQRPKIETFDDQIFVVVNLPALARERVSASQVSLFVGQGFLVSFCDGDPAVFDPVLARLQDAKSRTRASGVDYLLYALLDLVVDHGFPVLEDFGEQLEMLEQSVLADEGTNPQEDIHRVKRELIQLRRMLWPQREVISQLLRDDHELVHADTRVYLRDCYDHSIQIMDFLETYRDMAASLLDIYMSSVSNRMNRTMRVLTVIATIFIPLTFIVGVYGMNFDRDAGAWNMPELGWPFGYVAVWAVMLALAALMLLLFRRRGWL